MVGHADSDLLSLGIVRKRKTLLCSCELQGWSTRSEREMIITLTVIIWRGFPHWCQCFLRVQGTSHLVLGGRMLMASSFIALFPFRKHRGGNVFRFMQLSLSKHIFCFWYSFIHSLTLAITKCLLEAAHGTGVSFPRYSPYGIGN